MATQSNISKELRRILAAYPQHAARLEPSQVTAMLEVWQEDLADLPDDLLAVACRNHRERSQWLPSIAEIRASAVSLMRQASPARQSASEAWGDVKRAIASIGYVGSPEFSNPATAAVVRRMGWRDICMDDGPEGVIRAQFERMYNAEIERMESAVQQSPAVREFIGAMTINPDRQIAPGDTSSVIRRIAEARRAD
mgnify:CR=1 FL=1